MGRVEEIPQSPAAGTIDDAPPPSPPDEDLYEPPADYQPPSAAKKPPPPPRPFPPLQADDKPQHFPPPQPFPPNQYCQPQQNLNFPQQQFMQPPQRIQMGFVAQENEPWKSHLFDCMKNPQNAIITLLFPCVTFGQIAEILDNGSTSCATSGILYSCIAFCIGMPCLMSCGYRSKLRAKFGLVESPAPDCLIHCFCEYCALCQEYRELEDRGFDPSIGHAGNEAKQQRQRLQQFGMTPPMQQRMM
ncbi:protein PLANT CADMIUM RESISTANCE 7-like [Salvia miltiorrhiza]|uniref:protein PLANT CADMIUM RESISTANCE 7-like n=1 Tax=Salvia miltiorrhiza TaxID=226208 RepID=UPI0025ACEB26|nr:protein PLANT CADMIUM RESISTANCE 7-like [Salvia miltiorrhiza]